MQRLIAFSLLLLAIVSGLLPDALRAKTQDVVTNKAPFSENASIDERIAAGNRMREAAESAARKDSVARMDTTAVADSSEVENNSGLTAVVNYKATDSLVFSMGNMAYLYGSSEVTYDDINLTAERIQLSLDSSLVHANGVPDTTSENPNKMKGTPVFKDKSGEYETKTISYNFKSAKGYITDVVTTQGDGYVTGGITKKMPDNDIFLENGRYTTCDYHECPHFYIKLTKARVRPGKNIVTGPAYLVVADVPLPIAIPFGFFPFTKSYSSGLIMPTYGADMQQGLYLRNGGYYFAINDYIDLSLTGDIYTKGTWGLTASSKYAVRYKFSGDYSIRYYKSIAGEKGMPDYQEKNDFSVRWSHSQDNRFNPNLTLSASVDFQTSGYSRNNTAAYYSSDRNNATRSSSVSLAYKVPNSKWSFTSSFSIGQNMTDSTLSIKAPLFTATLSRIYPFKRKVKVGADRWYEKISFSYNGSLTNTITAKEDEILHKSLVKDWQNAASHKITSDATFTLFRYINVTPSITFNDNMYTKKVKQDWNADAMNPDGTSGAVVMDTTYCFANSFNYSMSLGASTTLYGMYTPIPVFKNPKLVAVRHLFKPTVSVSYNPDFTQTKYGTMGSYTRPNPYYPDRDTVMYYNYFQGAAITANAPRRAGAINFSMDNNIEAKIRSDKDSTGFRKISIIDQLSTGISYNMAADSMKWSETSSVNMTLKPSKNTTMNLNGTFDNYMYDLTPDGKSIHHVDKFRWAHGKLPRLSATSYSYSFQLSNKKVAAWFGHGSSEGGEDEGLDDDGFEEIDPTQDPDDPVYKREKERARMEKNKKKFSKKGSDDDGYQIWEIPWTMNLSYRMSYQYNTQNIDFVKKEFHRHIVHSLTLNGSVNPTKSWDFQYSCSYDFNLKRVTNLNLTFSRDMHCWTLRGSFSPLGQYAFFNVCIAVKSSMLSDLKYEKSSAARSNKIDWYDD